MGFYRKQILPRIVDLACGQQSARPLRRKACDSLAGDVIEIGFGTGHNVPFYPPAVNQVAAIEPTGLGWKLAGQRLPAATVPVRWSGLDGEALPFPDDTFDAGLSTWTLCTIPDVIGALNELRRVLKSGGAFHFLEHELAPDESVRRWQRRLEPLQKAAFGGCHLTRPIPDLLADAGFTITELEVFYEEGTPKFLGASCLGIAKIE